MLWRLISIVLVVAILGTIGIAGYTLVGELTPAPSQHSLSVTLDAQ